MKATKEEINNALSWVDELIDIADMFAMIHRQVILNYAEIFRESVAKGHYAGAMFHIGMLDVHLEVSDSRKKAMMAYYWCRDGIWTALDGEGPPPPDRNSLMRPLWEQLKG